MNLSELLRGTSRRTPDKTAFIIASSGRTVSYAAFDAEADRIASALAGFGIGPGDRVAIVMPNIPHFAFALYGTLRAGAIAVPLNVMLTPPEISRILNDSGARLALVAPPLDGGVRSAAESSPGVERVVSLEELEALPSAEFESIEAGDDDVAVLAYTSGTTGEPRGVMLTHGNLLANLRQQMEIPGADVRADDVLFLALPLFHIFGLNVTLGLLVLNGASGVLVEHFDPIPALRLIQEHKVSVIFGAPPMYVAWVNTPGADQYDLSSVRLAISGAAALSVEVLQNFRSLFGVDIYEGYGLTETAPTVTSSRMTDAPRPGSVGRPLPGVDVRLVDEDGNDVELGDPGEVLVRGPNVFKGYWNRTEETAHALRDGWLHTGDVAVQDEDGYLYLVDRRRDLIIVSGFNVFPSEVEAALLASPKVSEAAVIGVPHPYSGETVKAFVVLEPGTTASESELIADVQTRLARYKSPQSIEIVEGLPHLLTGKVLRRALRT